MGIESISLIVAAFVSGSLGVAALMRNFRSRLCLAFALFAGTLFIHDALSVLESFDSVFTYPNLHTTTVLFLGPFTLLLLQEVFPKPTLKIYRGTWGYLALVVGVALVLLFEVFPKWETIIGLLSHVLFLIPATLWIIGLQSAERQSNLSREKVRLRFGIWGAVFTLAFFSTDALAFSGYPVPPLGTFARSLYLLFLFQTFIQRDLLTKQEVVARLALFGMVTVMFSIVYSLLVSWVGDRQDLFYFNTLIASFVIMVLYEPVRGITLRLTRRLLLRKNTMMEEELNRLSSDLLGMVEPLGLAKRITDSLQKCLGVESASLYLLDRDGLSYVRIGQEGEMLFLSFFIEYMII